MRKWNSYISSNGVVDVLGGNSESPVGKTRRINVIIEGVVFVDVESGGIPALERETLAVVEVELNRVATVVKK